MNRPCIFSPCGKYRYTLWRRCQGMFNLDGIIQFIGLNPSTADDRKDDPTVRRCRRMADRWGYEWFCMTNLFAYRATDPEEMKKVMQALKLDELKRQAFDNLEHLHNIARNAKVVVAAWGVHGEFMGAGRSLVKYFDENGIKLHCLGVTKEGHPKHPLYLRNSVTLVPYPPDNKEHEH